MIKMFSSNQSKESEITNLDNIKIIDPFTKWLIRIACIFIIYKSTNHTFPYFMSNFRVNFFMLSKLVISDSLL